MPRIPSPFNYPLLLPNQSRLSRHNISHQFKVASWNLQGKLSAWENCKNLVNNAERLKVDIIVLQETKAGDILYQDNVKQYQILGFPYTQKAYGLAFVIKTKIHIKDTECIFDRIVAINVNLHDIHQTSKDSDRHRPSTMTIINVYAPHHSIITAQSRVETDRFYDQLQLTYNSYRTYYLYIYIASANVI